MELEDAKDGLGDNECRPEQSYGQHEEAEGLLAVCIQHEIDHLNGKIFVDYLSKLKQDRARDKVRKVIKQREKDAEHKSM